MAVPGVAISSPYSRILMRSTSSSSTSMTTSARALSMALITLAAASIFSGVSLMVIALIPCTGDSRRLSTTSRSTSSVSFTSALLK